MRNIALYKLRALRAQRYALHTLPSLPPACLARYREEARNGEEGRR